VVGVTDDDVGDIYFGAAACACFFFDRRFLSLVVVVDGIIFLIFWLIWLSG